MLVLDFFSKELMTMTMTHIIPNQPISVIQMDESGACQNFYRIL